MKYVIGLDVGIGSVGWAVVRNEENCKRIEDFGVRVFETGEDPQKKTSFCQERRGYRSVRRLLRRRAHRKMRLKRHFQNIGLISENALKAYFESGKNDVIEARVKAINERVSREELAASLVNICNRRGYRDFYESAETDEDYEALEAVNKIMEENHYRTPAEMIKNDPEFNDEMGRHYRNGKDFDETYLISRKYMLDEAKLILDKQSEFYDCLTEDNKAKIIDIIFSQRCFEDGPGDVNDPYRRYKGFLDKLGKCRFYPDEERGCRFTAIADVYAVSNVLSQYKYINKETGEIYLPQIIAGELINHVVNTASALQRDIKKIVRAHGYEISISKETESISKCIKFLGFAKKCLEENGYSWGDFCADWDDENGRLNQIGITLSKFVTPSRRKTELKKLGFLNDGAVESFARQRISGTSNVSYKYMKDAAESFLEGDIYGSFQADFNKAVTENLKESDNFKLPPFNKSSEFFNNPVVTRAINETRKIVNAIVDRYGSPWAINIEVASEVNKSADQRADDERHNRDNEKQRDYARKAIAELLSVEENTVTGGMIEKYLLGESQEWRCLYSDRIIDMKECLSGKTHAYEVDHIVPFSLILDNTKSNKALVYASENQLKKQRTPLMYLEGERRDRYLDKVRQMFKSGKINEKKYKYLMLEDLNCSEILGDWKSRNINDTRYIAKYLVKYLSENLRFSEKDGTDKYRTRVYAVKSAITSMCRKNWLNRDTWGRYDKGELKNLTYLDHAADAVVIANCLPAYVEIAYANLKLKSIYKSSGKTETEEYKNTLANAVEYISRFYGFNKNYLERLLTKKIIVPSLCENIKEEVEARFVDYDIFREFEKERAEKKSEDAREFTNEEIDEIFRNMVENAYPDDPAFAAECRMPVTSYKVNKKFSGKATEDTLLRIKNIDGKDCLLSRKKIVTLKEADVDKIYGDDRDLKDSLRKLFAENSEKTVGDILNKLGKKHFITEKGNRIHTVTLIGSMRGKPIFKQIDENNRTILNNGGYYCIEFYKTVNDELGLRGISYSELKKEKGKLKFREGANPPEDYKEHIMYVYKNEYIEVTDRNGRIKEKSGVFVSVVNINQMNLCMARYNTPNNSRKPLSVNKKDSVRKYYYDILGRRGGEVKSCGEQLL